MTCTKTEPKNDLFLNCRRKRKELSKKELSNVAPASIVKQAFLTDYDCSNVAWIVYKDLIHVFANHCSFCIYLTFIVLLNKILNSPFEKIPLTRKCVISFQFVACGFLLPQQTIQIIGTQANLLSQL